MKSGVEVESSKRRESESGRYIFYLFIYLFILIIQPFITAAPMFFPSKLCLLDIIKIFLLGFLSIQLFYNHHSKAF